MFNIYAADDIGKTRPIGYVARVWPGCLKSLATDADNFVIEYPVDATPVQKAAISAVPILIDYLSECRGRVAGVPPTAAAAPLRVARWAAAGVVLACCCVAPRLAQVFVAASADVATPSPLPHPPPRAVFENNGQRNGNGGSNMLGDVLNILL